MALFKDRQDAGSQLALLLAKYRGHEIVVYAIPRGGIAVAEPIAAFLNAPMDLILAHKIGHPYQPEYAIAAVSESGHMVGSTKDLYMVDENWLEGEKEKQMQEIKRKRENYLKEMKEIPLRDKIAIIVDDGIATGLTMKAGILELRGQAPYKIVAAVPVVSRNTAEALKNLVDDLVAIDIPEDMEFLGAVGAYYQQFEQLEDDTAMALLKKHAKIGARN